MQPQLLSDRSNLSLNSWTPGAPPLLTPRTRDVYVSPVPRLTLTRPNLEERLFEFEDGTISIGRAGTNSVQVEEPAADPEHCLIEASGDGRFKLVDLETKNGTSVNGKKVNAHVLSHNDQIQIGQTCIRYEEPAADDYRTRRIQIIRPRRRGRLPSPRPPAAPVPPGIDDLQRSISALVGQLGFDEARRTLERLHQEQLGQGLFEGLQDERDKLARLLEVAKLISSEHNLKRLLELILDSVIEMAGAERGFIILRERENLVIKVARNFDRESIRRPEFKVSHSVAERVLRDGKPVLSADAISDPTLPAASVAALKLRSLLCLPLRVRDQAVGCVYIDNRFEAGLFSPKDLPLLQGFADQAAIAVDNARLFEENTRRQEELKRSREEIEQLNAQLKQKVEKQYAELSKARQDLISTRQSVALKHDFSEILGKSRAMQEVFYLLDRVIDTDEPVYVYGESGTGKELAARAIHFNSPRATAGKFVSENCSAIPDTLLESELFGHEKGAFTGAVATKIGLFELAHKGTLFLDEIGDMSVDMQKKVLRAIQEGEIRRVGGKDVIKVDVRIISASNKDLSVLIKTGAFREDLFYRLNVVQITLPPLRDRREDVPLLVDHFLDKIARDNGQPKRKVDEVAFWYLQNYSWPGNIRELDNEIRRAVALSDETITVDSLKDEIRQKDLFRPAVKVPAGGQLKDIVREAIEDVERRMIAKTLEECSWKKTEAAARLGVSRPTLDAKIEAYGLSRGKEAP
jgi:transcriptional regulator with GAF, ATPase, and Fis domain